MTERGVNGSSLPNTVGSSSGIQTDGTGGKRSMGGGDPVRGGGIAPSNGDNGQANLEAQAFNRALWGQAGDSGANLLDRSLFQLTAGYGDLRRSEAGLQPIFFFDFRTSGLSFHNAPLGVQPDGNLFNGAEIVFFCTKETLPLGVFSFRFRQAVQQRSWEFTEGSWREMYRSPREEADDPDPLSQKIDVPLFKMYDSPGWPPLTPRSLHQLNLGPGVTNTAKALQVAVQMHFQTWVDGDFEGVWKPVSQVLDWFSVQWLTRTDTNSDWITAPGTRIGHGLRSVNVLRNPIEIDI